MKIISQAKETLEKELYHYVFKQLLRMPLFIGIYKKDALDNSYMCGAASVMGYIAIRGRDEDFDYYNSLWSDNMDKSEGRR